MYACAGDRLIVEGDPARTALIVRVPHDDGSPPYVVKWLTDGHIAMVTPGQFARVIPAGHPAGTSRLPLQGRPNLRMGTATPVSSSPRPALPENRKSVRTHRGRGDDLAELTRILASSQYPALPPHVQSRIEGALAAEAADRQLVSSRSRQPARSHASQDKRTSRRRTVGAEARDRLNRAGPGVRG